MRGFTLIIKPDEEEAAAAEVLVEGTIGGRAYRFLLDTGSARTTVVYDGYTAAFDCVETSDSSGVFASSRDDLITVPSIELGPIARHDFTVARMAAQAPARRNLIGMDLLKDFCCYFLFDENRVTVDGSGEDTAGYAFQALFLDRKFHPYVEVQFGALKAQAVWDTGAGITVVDLGLIERHPAFFAEAGRSTGTDSTGSSLETPLFIMAETVIGGHVFAPHKVAGVDLAPVNATTDVPMDLILGYSTLSQANWLFDFPRQRWAVSKRLGLP